MTKHCPHCGKLVKKMHTERSRITTREQVAGEALYHTCSKDSLFNIPRYSTPTINGTCIAYVLPKNLYIKIETHEP